MYITCIAIYICIYMQAGRMALELAKDDATFEVFKRVLKCEALKCERTFEAHR